MLEAADGFFKGQALGNDYLVVETARLGFAVGPRSVPLLCDRRTGLGADGVVAIESLLGLWGVDLAAEVVVHNADGTTAELSGNGLRIAALALGARKPAWTRMILRSAGRDYPIGRARAEDLAISIELPAPRVGALRERLEVNGREVLFTGVDVGNPHAVIEASTVSSDDFPAIARGLETHPHFPHRTNVERVHVPDAGAREIAIDIHERGVGPTEASGTGACASAAAAVALGLVPGAGRIEVSMRGGRVRVDVGEKGLVLTGPVEAIASGAIAPAFVARLRATRRS